MREALQLSSSPIIFSDEHNGGGTVARRWRHRTWTFSKQFSYRCVRLSLLFTISKLIFWELAWIWTDLSLNLQPRVSRLSSNFFEFKPYIDLLFMLMMNLYSNSKNKRWMFMIFVFRVRPSIFFKRFQIFTSIHRLIFHLEPSMMTYELNERVYMNLPGFVWRFEQKILEWASDLSGKRWTENKSVKLSSSSSPVQILLRSSSSLPKPSSYDRLRAWIARGRRNCSMMRFFSQEKPLRTWYVKIWKKLRIEWFWLCSCNFRAELV